MVSLHSSVNHGLLKRLGTVEVLGTALSAILCKMEVNSEIGSSVSSKMDGKSSVPQRDWNKSQSALSSFHRGTLSLSDGPLFLSNIGK